MTELGEFAMFLAVGFTALGLVFGPIGGAIARRISGRNEPAEGTRRELEELPQRLPELEGQQRRLDEVEERVEFAERLLTRRDEGQIASE